MAKQVLLAAVLALLCAAPPRRAAGGEVSPDEFLDRFSALLDTSPEPPEVSEAEVVELEEGDPETYIFVRGALAHPPAPQNLGGDGRLTLARPGFREVVTARYRGADGAYAQAEIDKLSRLLRCSRTGRQAEVSIKLLEILDAVEDRFGAPRLLVLSGYRTPRFNREVPGAARRSLHMLGWAADIRVPGRTHAEVAGFAAALAAGGVGHYEAAGFVHLDSGRARSWKAPRQAPRKKSPRPAK